MRRTPLLLALVLALGMAAVSTVPAGAQTVVGVTATEIKIGNTNPYSGPASAYGTIGKTIAAYFKKVNDEGGINGRKINFITYDDAYTPPKTVEMVRKLVEQDQVAALFQTLGTPTNTAIHKYVNQQRCRTSSWPPAPPSGTTRSTSRGPWATSPTTRPRAASTRSTS